MASLSNAVHNKVCTCTHFLWVRVCFRLHLVSVDFIFQKWPGRSSHPGLAALASSCALYGPKKEESLQSSICRLSCLGSLWCTCPHIFPGGFEIHGYPECVASLISLCFNTDRTGTPFCHPVVCHIPCALHTAWPQVHNQYPRSDTGPRSDRIQAQAGLFGSCQGPPQ